ncbi:MAG TPA: DMT family transporter, partial [Quisquiliibacterium sp.]|nr:DMT family transporter [Quisquiliibacterium sp.]
LGVACVLVTVACNIGFQLLTRSLATSDDSRATIFLTSLVGTVLSAALLPFQQAWGGWPEHLGAFDVVLLAALGVLGVVSQWCLIRAYVWSSASFIAPLVFLQIVWATLSGWTFFGQLPDGLAAAGMVLIAASGIGAMLSEARATRRA